MVKESLMGVQELAAKLNVPVSWIYQHTRIGPKAIPHIRVGKYVRFDIDEVMKFFKSQGHPVVE